MLKEILSRVIVRDAMGQTVLETDAVENKSLVVGFESLQPGVYIVIVSNQNSEKTYKVDKK